MGEMLPKQHQPGMRKQKRRMAMTKAANTISSLERSAQQMHMKLQQVSDSCFAVMCEKNRVCDANSGLVNRGGGLAIDTQSDLAHARKMIELFGTVWKGMPKYVAITHEDGDHVWGNQFFKGAEIIAHRSVPERMKFVAEPEETRNCCTVLIVSSRAWCSRCSTPA
jgi:hypothetical protein